MKKQAGFSLLETLITMVIVGILSSLCGVMLVFGYSMFEKIMGNGFASVEYKTFRFRTERIFRNMTSHGPLIREIIDNDDGQPALTPEKKERSIKLNVEFYKVQFDGEIRSRKYDQPWPADISGDIGVRYNVNGDNTVIDPGTWNGHVGREVSVYSCVEAEKIDENYRRYMMRLEHAENGKKIVVLYTWELNPKGTFVDDVDEIDSNYPMRNAVREVLLSDVTDFQVTPWLSNLYVNRIKLPKYENIAVVRLYVQLGGDIDAQYSNDMIFANKSVYGDIDSFFDKGLYPERMIK